MTKVGKRGPKPKRKGKRTRNLNALYRKGSLGSRRWKIDIDYINKLTDKEKQFLNDFIEEYYLANFQHAGKKLHRTKEQRRERYYENSVSNRCVVSLNGVRGQATTTVVNADQGKMNTIIDFERSTQSFEDALVDYLDYKMFNVGGDKEEL